MAPIKFEDNIREKLQERELQPSKEAWEKLSRQLDEQMPQSKRTSFFWLAVAASFIGILIIASFLFRSEKTMMPIVKEGPNKIRIEEEQFEPAVDVTQEVIKSESLEDLTPLRTELTNNEPKSNRKDRKVISMEGSISSTTENRKGYPKKGDTIALASNDEKHSENRIQDPKEDDLFQMKIDEVVAEVHARQENNDVVTLDEIDALLAKAQRDISNQRMLRERNQKIDASALLMDVELELEQNFRERVFQILGDGFNKIRTAVSERNN